MDVRIRRERVEQPAHVHTGLQGHQILASRSLTDRPVVVAGHNQADDRRDREPPLQEVVSEREEEVLEGP